MSFLFGKSKKPAPATGGLPPATRNIPSAHGERTMIPTANGLTSPRDFAERPRDGQQKNQTPTPGSSVNASINSLQSTSPEPTGIREISDADMPVSAYSEALSTRSMSFVASGAGLRLSRS